MKKGTNPSQIFLIIDKLKKNNPNLDITELMFKYKVIDEYNNVYSISSKDTIISNLREDAIINFQDNLHLIKLPQDNNKVDILGVKIENDIVKMIVSQQKGNNSSFNSTSYQKTLEKLQFFHDNKLIENYFHLLPDELNPNKNNLPYHIEIIIGMTIAVGNPTILDEKRNIILYSNNDYLCKLGIINHDIMDIDYWIINQEKIKNHNYDAISKCCDFDYVYEKCIQKLINDGY